MEIENLIRQKKDLYSVFLNFIEASDDSKDKFKLLIDMLEKQKILNNQKEIQSIFYLLSKVADNHHRTSDFFNKFEQIYQYIFKTKQNPISEFISIFQEYNIRILLLLFKKEFVKPDESFFDDYFRIYKTIQFKKTFSDENFNDFQYCYYLYPVIKQYIPEQMQKQIEDDISQKFQLKIDEFDKKCQIGENDSYICSLIRQDSIEEFITYMNKINLSPLSEIKQSIFETNSLLKNKKTSIIEYAFFFGSIQIIQYLKNNKVPFEITLWKYAVHSNNPEIINFLEENLEITFSNDKSGLVILKEPIKCHHNNIVDYIKNNYLSQNEDESNNYNGLISCCDKCIIESSNFYFYPKKIDPIISRNYLKKNFTISHLIFSLTAITIPSSVTRIGDFAFSGCKSLTQISIPSSVMSIGESAFKSIKKLTIIGDIKVILLHMFDCSSLEQISIQSSITSIESYAFNKCSFLNKISIPCSLVSIGEYAFSECSSLTEFTIPSLVASIGKGAFNKCKLLAKVIIHSPLTSIESYTFNECSSLVQILIPSSVTSIKEKAFSGCSSLKEILIPPSVTLIGDYAFSECPSLIKITIPPSVTSIGVASFNKCKSLTQISIPLSVTSIKDFTFNECSSLMQISIPSSITSFGNYAFHLCISLNEIEISASVKSIGNNAFKNCSSLKRINIPSNITIINDYTFYGCSSLTEITIPSSVTSIGKYSFCACSSLTNISIPSSINIIKSNAFNRCSSIKQITIPSSATLIEEGAFSWCTSLKSIDIKSSIKTIENHLFAGCSSLENIMIPSSVSSFGEYSFCGCSSLEKISIPSSLTSIPNFLFSWCYSLKKVSIPSSVKSIGDYAFFNCDNLIDVGVTSSIKEVGIDSFSRCLLLKTLPNFIEKVNLTQTLNINDYTIEKLINLYYSGSSNFKSKNKNSKEEFVINTYHDGFFQNATDFIKMVECSQLDIPGFVKIQNYRFPISENLTITINNKSYDFSYYITSSVFVKYGDISDMTKQYLNSNGLNSQILNPTVRSKIIFGVAAIMKKLHDKNIIHRDLRMSKILLDDNCEPMILPSRYTVIVNDSDELEKIFFISYNMAPEMHANDNDLDSYSFPVDVYAYGFFLYEMFSSEIKYGMKLNSYGLKRYIEKGLRPARPENIPDHYWKLVQMCWDQFDDLRPSFTEILDILKDDKYAIEEFSMKTNLNELHEYRKRIEF